jgi:NitT/TauT family transport system permease protein
VSGTAGPRPARRWHGLLVVLLPTLVALVVLGAWLLVSYVLLDERRRFLLPPPQEVLLVGLVDARNRAELLGGLAATSKVALTGLAIAILLGSAWALLMSRSPWVERSLYPWAVVLQTIPVLALIPVIGFWFGFAFASRVVVCVLIAIFPITTNTLFGLRSVQAGHKDLFRVRRASRWETFVHLELPSALPSVLTGWRIAAGLSVIGAIVGDFYFQRGPAGIGRLLNGYTQRLQSEQLFAAVLLCSLLGLVVFWFFGLLIRLFVTPWHESGHAGAPE